MTFDFNYSPGERFKELNTLEFDTARLASDVIGQYRLDHGNENAIAAIRGMLWALIPALATYDSDNGMKRFIGQFQFRRGD